MDTSQSSGRIDRVISWFSCGAASAVATKLAIQEHGEVEVIYQDTGSEHPDNKRFLKDCEEWFGQEIKVLKSEKYKDIYEVFRARKYIVGVAGAPCTYELKRKVAEDYLNFTHDLEIFGYTADEEHRVNRFKEQNPERIIQAILVERGLTKDDCLGMIERAGIEIPAMYLLGYNNNNCIGCVKGQMGYWNKIRKDFPDVFEKTAKLEREMGAAINKTYIDGKRTRVFLDELDPNAGNLLKEPSISCGIMCEMEYQRITE